MSDLPGIQVIIPCYNAAPYLHRCLQSVENALVGYNWILIVGNDGCSDNSDKILSNYKSQSAAQYIYQKFPKSSFYGVAKNKTVALGKFFKEKYPIICLMDADDVMGKNRINHLLPFIVQNKHLAVCGDHIRVGRAFPDHQRIFRVKENAHFLGNFGPWATLFHASLIPENDKLFREDVHGYDDGLLHAKWLRDGIKIVSHGGEIVHYYLRRKNTIFTPDKKKEEEVNRKFKDLIFEYFYGQKIDLGLQTKLTLYSVFIDGMNPQNFISNFLFNYSYFEFYPELEFIIVDLSKNFVIETMIKYELVKELACQVIKYLHCYNISEKEINLKLANLAKANIVGLMSENFKLCSAMIGKVLNTNFDNILCEDGLVCIKKGFLIKNNS